MSDMTVTFSCSSCGTPIPKLPDDSTDETEVTCANCGLRIGTWGEIKVAGMQKAKDHMQGLMKDAFRKGGWKVD